MKRSTVVYVAGCVSFVTLTAVGGYAQQASERGVGDESGQQKWVEFMTPGPEHDVLAHKAGKWTVKIEMWRAPDAKPLASEGTAETELIMGGRYLLETIRSEFEGQPFAGKRITGYDKLKEKFVSVWIDNFGTGFTISSGSYDEAAKKFEYTTTSPDAARAGYKRTRTVERLVGEDERILEVYDVAADGQEFLTMKAVFQREDS